MTPYLHGLNALALVLVVAGVVAAITGHWFAVDCCGVAVLWCIWLFSRAYRPPGDDPGEGE